MSFATIASFLIVLALTTAAGAASVIRKQKTPEDYLVASRDVSPWLAALSAVSTNNSGFMFIGMIAYSYREGIESIWMMVGWILGDLLGWAFVHPRVRRISGALEANSLPGLIGTREGTADRVVIAAGGIVTLLFLGIYAAGQLKAGSTALHALFGWEMWIGAAIGAAIVILYFFAGGIRADLWTDAAQSFVMIGAMVLLVVASWNEIGGPSALARNLEAQDPKLLSVLPDGTSFGSVPFILGFAFAGLGAIGQPHLMTRIMALDSPRSIRAAAGYYFAWYVPFFIASIGVGLYARAVLPELSALPMAREMREPTELALPLLTMELLPDVFVGIALAGLFAATISTADSQIIVCSAALTQDIFPRWKDSYRAGKLATFAITAFAMVITLFAPEGVFGLVLIAWSVMGAALGPPLVLRLFDRPLGTRTACAMMGAALATVVAWHLSPWDDDLFKILPGAIAAMVVYGFVRLAARFRARSR